MEACLDPATMNPNICPAAAPPEGLTAMTPNPYRYSPHGMAITTAVCLAFLVPAVSIRMFTKGYILRRLQVEDYCLLVAVAGCLAISGVMNYAYSTYRVGRHQWDTSIADFVGILKYINLVQILYSPFMIFAKIALLLQIQRIFVPPKQRNFIFWASWTLIVLNTIVYTCTFFAFVFACWPREKIWTPTLPGKCLNTGAVMIVTSVINLLSDATILVLPMKAIWGLQLGLKKKLGVGAVFATGLLAISASITRLVYTVRLADTLHAVHMDVTYIVAPTGMWAAAEYGTVLLCCTFPTFPRFVSWARGTDRNRRNSLRYSTDSSQHRRMKSMWGEMMTTEIKIGSGVALWERQNSFGNSKAESQESLGPGFGLVLGPNRVEDGGIWRTVDIETSSVRIGL